MLKFLTEPALLIGKTSIIESDSSSFGKKYNIRTRFQFYISGKINLYKFGELINFSHTRKRNDLKILLQKYKTYKSEELKELVLKQLKLNVDGINASEISEKLNRKYSGSFRHFLCKLEREGVISSTKRKNLKTYVIK